MSTPAVLAEIARLESELHRIQRELDALRRAVGAPSAPKRTQAFPSPIEAQEQEQSRITPPPGVPQPSVPVTSETIPTSRNRSDRRVQQHGRTGLTDYPPTPNPNPTPTKRNANHDPAAGRYEYVGEGRSKRR